MFTLDHRSMSLIWVHVFLCRYSINYHHFGAPKQWYGVPGSGAAALEASFRSQMPDEFEKRPLLLHDLVTMVRAHDITSSAFALF
jgi:histone demethylase JARID1